MLAYWVMPDTYNITLFHIKQYTVTHHEGNVSALFILTADIIFLITETPKGFFPFEVIRNALSLSFEYLCYGSTAILKHTTTLFALSDHDILSREWYYNQSSC